MWPCNSFFFWWSDWWLVIWAQCHAFERPSFFTVRSLQCITHHVSCLGSSSSRLFALSPVHVLFFEEVIQDLSLWAVQESIEKHSAMHSVHKALTFFHCESNNQNNIRKLHLFKNKITAASSLCFDHQMTKLSRFFEAARISLTPFQSAGCQLCLTCLCHASVRKHEGGNVRSTCWTSPARNHTRNNFHTTSAHGHKKFFKPWLLTVAHKKGACHQPPSLALTASSGFCVVCRLRMHVTEKNEHQNNAATASLLLFELDLTTVSSWWQRCEWALCIRLTCAAVFWISAGEGSIQGWQSLGRCCGKQMHCTLNTSFWVQLGW